MPRRGQRLISFRLSLLIAISILVVVTGASIIATSVVLGRRTVTSLAMRLFRATSEQAVSRTRSHMYLAVPAIELNRQRIQDGRLAPTASVLLPEFLDMLRVNPSFARVSYGNSNGSFVGAIRTAEGTLRTNESHLVSPGQSDVIEYDIDANGAGVLHRHATTANDPRTSVWYQLAERARARVWTPPYVFSERGLPRISCAVPILGADGTVSGVLTVDFALEQLSQFVRRLQPSPTGIAFIFTPDEVIVADPTPHLAGGAERRGAGALLTLANSGAPHIRAFRDQLRARHGGHLGDEADEFTFMSDGHRYIATYNPFVIDHELHWVAGTIAPESEFLSDVARNSVVSGIASALALLAALVVGAFLARRISEPLRSFASQIEDVGHFRVAESPPRSTILLEVDMMNRALLSMKRGLRSFASYVPQDLVRAMLASGQEAALGGQLKVLTIFFSDIAEFTSLAERMKPDELVRMLGGYLDAMTGVIARKQGTVDKYLGDGIMAFWGAPEDVPEHAALACEAALLCDRTLAELRASGGTEVGTITARIGLATGEVLVGNIGTPARMNYTVIGDTANLASRLEGLNKQYGTSVLVSEETFRAANGRVVARAIDVVAVKGRARGVRVYELLATQDEATEAVRQLATWSSEALDAYLARDFPRAVAGWEKVLGTRPGDRATEVMIARARAYAIAPPDDAWDGVYVAKVK